MNIIFLILWIVKNRQKEKISKITQIRPSHTEWTHEPGSQYDSIEFQTPERKQRGKRYVGYWR